MPIVLSARCLAGRRHNFAVLFCALIVLSVVSPVLSFALGPAGYWVAEVSFLVALVIALWGVALSRAVLALGLGLILVNGVFSVMAVSHDSLSASRVADVSALFFLCICVFAAGFEVFRRDAVDLNKILGGLSIYLLLGVVWAIAYRLLERAVPESFAGLDADTSGELR